jgi:hypothetical protein
MKKIVFVLILFMIFLLSLPEIHAQGNECVYGTATATAPVSYGNYKFYATLGGSTFVKLAIKNNVGDVVENLLLTGWSQGTSASKDSSVTNLTVTVFDIKALQDGTVVGANLGIGPIGMWCGSCSYGTVTATDSIIYPPQYKIYADMGATDYWARVVVKDLGTGNILDTKTINQGDSWDFSSLNFTVKVISVYAKDDGTVLGVELIAGPKQIACGHPPKSKISMDKTVYVRYETATITYSGFKPYETLKTTLCRKGGGCAIGGTETPSNSTGSGVHHTYMETGYDPGDYTFTLSDSSGNSASAYFTLNLKVSVKLNWTNDTYSRYLGIATNRQLNNEWWLNYGYTCNYIITPSDIGKEFSCEIPFSESLNSVEVSVSSAVGYKWNLVVSLPNNSATSCSNIDRYNRCPPRSATTTSTTITNVTTTTTSTTTTTHITTTTVNSTPISCTDSDGEKNYYVKGTCVYKYLYGGSEQTATYVDDCVYDADAKKLTNNVVDCYCVGNQIRTSVYTCPNGCKDGACISEKTQCPYECCENDPTYSDKYCPQLPCKPCEETRCPSCSTYLCQDHKCVSQSGHEIKFYSGWNIFSLPLKPTSELKSDCKATSKLWHYSTETGNYEEIKDIMLNGKTGWGYWLKVSEDCSVTVSGTKISVDNFEKLNTGWNQIGGPAEPVKFSTIVGDCKVVGGPWRYNALTGQYEKTDYLNPGEGYWINVENSCELSSEIPPLPPSLIGTIFGRIMGHMVRMGV